MANDIQGLPETSKLMGAFPKAPKGYVGPQELAPALQEIDVKSAESQKALGESDIRMEKAKREEAATTGELKKAFYEKEKEAELAMPERAATKAAREDLAAAKFEPTKDTVQDIAGLFSLMGVVGMVIGKKNALQGMYAMNGMMEGHIKGRKDLFTREAAEFDKQFKILQAKVESATKELEEARKLRIYDQKAGEEAIAIAVARSESPLIKEMVARTGIEKTINVLKQTRDTVNKMAEQQNALQSKADERQFKLLQEQRRIAHENRIANISEARLRLAEDKAARGEGGKPLKEKEVQQIEGLSSLSQELRKLEKEFKPEYASLGLLGFGADLSMEAKRRLGSEEGAKAVQWWSKYERLQAPNRHALFGATLTGNELKNYQSFTAKKSDDPTIVKNMLLDQADYSDATAQEKALGFERAGYKVPEIRPRSFLGTYKGVGGSEVKSFSSVEEAEKANLPSGTKITINGRSATVE